MYVCEERITHNERITMCSTRELRGGHCCIHYFDILVDFNTAMPLHMAQGRGLGITQVERGGGGGGLLKISLLCDGGL